MAKELIFIPSIFTGSIMPLNYEAFMNAILSFWSWFEWFWRFLNVQLKNPFNLNSCMVQMRCAGTYLCQKITKKNCMSLPHVSAGSGFMRWNKQKQNNQSLFWDKHKKTAMKKSRKQLENVWEIKVDYYRLNRPVFVTVLTNRYLLRGNENEMLCQNLKKRKKKP